MENKLKQGEALFSEGKIEEAEKCFLDLLDKNPENSEILNNVGVIHYTRGDLEEAEAFFFKASSNSRHDSVDWVFCVWRFTVLGRNGLGRRVQTRDQSQTIYT